MAAVDEHRELHGAGPSELGQCVHGGAHGAPGVEHVVDEHHHAAADVDRHFRRTGRCHRTEADVVAIEGDVEGTDGDRETFELLDGVGQAACQRQAPGVEPDEHHVVGTTIALHDLVGDTGLRPANVAGVEHAHRGPSRRSLTGLPSRSRADYQLIREGPSTRRADMTVDTALTRYFDAWNSHDPAQVLAALTDGGTY
jgi:hypothetical protein